MKRYNVKAFSDGRLFINDKPLLKIAANSESTDTANIKLVIATVTHSHEQQRLRFDELFNKIENLEKEISELKDGIQIEIDYHPDIGKETHAAKQRFDQNKTN